MDRLAKGSSGLRRESSPKVRARKQRGWRDKGGSFEDAGLSLEVPRAGAAELFIVTSHTRRGFRPSVTNTFSTLLWLHKDYVLAMLAKRKADRLRPYREFVSVRDTDEILQVFSRKTWPWV